MNNWTAAALSVAAAIGYRPTKQQKAVATQGRHPVQIRSLGTVSILCWALPVALRTTDDGRRNIWTAAAFVRCRRYWLSPMNWKKAVATQRRHRSPN